MSRTSANRDLALETALKGAVTLIKSIHIHEELGRPFRAEVDFTSEAHDIDFDKLIGTNATVRMNFDGSKVRYFNGFIARVVQDGHPAAKRENHYRALVVPWVWFLTRYADCRIFQNQSVPDIIQKVFRSRGLNDFKLNIKAGDYKPKDYCVQYRETDFNFVSRLMEQEGIYYYFEHENGKHTLVLCDAPASHKPIEEAADGIVYRPPADAQTNNRYITDWVYERQLLPTAFAHTDYNFLKPSTELKALSQIKREHGWAKGEIFDYPGEYEEVADGTRYSKVRAEELQSPFHVARARSDVRTMQCGRTFKLAECPREDQNAEYLITSTTISAEAEEFGSGGGQKQSFAMSFTCVPATTPFRSARTTPKPTIPGAQTAIVVGTSGEEVWTDKHARVMVKFFWDRHSKAEAAEDGPSEKNSSCWIRVAQVWAGKNWGAMFIPRVGQEVIVEFLEGDPDHPIITGRVYNAENMPPYELPANKTQSGIRSNSSKGGQGCNELRFEDKKDDEDLFLHAQKRADIRVKQDSFMTVENNHHLQVTNDAFEHIKNDRHEIVDNNHHENIKKSRHVKIDEDEVKKIIKKKTLQVTDDVIEEFGKNQSTKVAEQVTIKAKVIVLEADDNITLKVGGNTFVIGTDGMKGEAQKIEFDSKSDFDVKATANVKLEATANFEAKGATGAKVSGLTAKLAGDTTAEVSGSASAKLSGGGMCEISGGLVKIN
jgi:type VI secretion system secreted protein VgrG